MCQSNCKISFVLQPLLLKASILCYVPKLVIIHSNPLPCPRQAIDTLPNDGISWKQQRGERPRVFYEITGYVKPYCNGAVEKAFSSVWSDSDSKVSVPQVQGSFKTVSGILFHKFMLYQIQRRNTAYLRKREFRL